MPESITRTEFSDFVNSNESYKALPACFKRDFNILVKDKLKRAYVRDIKGK